MSRLLQDESYWNRGETSIILIQPIFFTHNILIKLYNVGKRVMYEIPFDQFISFSYNFCIMHNIILINITRNIAKSSRTV